MLEWLMLDSWKPITLWMSTCSIGFATALAAVGLRIRADGLTMHTCRKALRLWRCEWARWLFGGGFWGFLGVCLATFEEDAFEEASAIV